jgi:superfamily II DNA/RNA helicase
VIARAKNTNKPPPSVSHEFKYIKQSMKQDKLVELLSLLKIYLLDTESAMIFCNTPQSCRAVDYYLNENSFPVTSLHGDMPPKVAIFKFKFCF